MGVLQDLLPRRENPAQRFELLKQAAAKARLPYDKDVHLNVAFFLDEQYVEWVADANSIRSIPRAAGFENIPRPVTNKMMHFAATEHAMTLQDRPTVDVMPGSDDIVDASEAAVSLAYVQWLADPQICDYDGQLSDAVLWALVGGEGFLKHTYNPATGYGDIMSCSPLDIYPDPYAKHFNKSRYVIHSQFMDPEAVYDLYNKEVKPNEMQRADYAKNALTRELGISPVLQGCIVNELWLLPNRRYPQGLFVVWTGKEILYRSTYPYQHNRLPFVQLGSIPRPGSPHYTCALKYLRAPQMELNKYHAQRIMIREAFANPKWWVPPGLELEQDPDDTPRQILRGHGGTDPNLKPEIIQPTSMAGGDEGTWMTEEMMHVVGLHEVSQAQVPGRVESSKAIEILKDADAGRLQELRRTIKSATSEGFWQQLQLAKQYVKEELLVSTYSRDGIQEVKRFKGEMVQPGLRVIVTMTTGLSGSRAAREEKLGRWYELGIIRDPAVMAELLEVPMGRLDPGRAQDIRLARNENLQMAQGIPVSPNSWDDHEVHIHEHNQYRKTSEYQGLASESKTMFEFHVEQHDIQQVHELQKMIQKQMLAQGMATGGAPGSPPPPQSAPGSGGAPDPTEEETPQQPPTPQGGGGPAQ